MVAFQERGVLPHRGGVGERLTYSERTCVEIDLYNMVTVCLEKMRGKISVKYHAIAMLDCNVILSAWVTDRGVGDEPTLRRMLKEIPDLEGSWFNADKAYDSDRCCQLPYEKGLRPNIKQRRKGGRRNRGLRFRRRAGEEFDEAAYRYRGLVEGIFGAEESGRGLRTRCRLRRTQRRWGLAGAVGHNLAVLNRLRCARRLHVTLQPMLVNVEA